ncbi:MAG TPA: hypothetical protein VGS41_04735 [Chthonomonadales bacterium]|nr:hypothetical protein [Chthonomonadales bacterium]
MSWTRYQFQVMRLEVHEIEASSLDSARAYAKEWCDSQRLPFGILMFDHCVAAPVILRAVTPIPDAMPREAA